MKTAVHLLIILFALSASCRFGTTGTYVNDNIPAAEKAAIGTLDAQVVAAMLANDYEALSAVFAPALVEKSGMGFRENLPQIAEQITSPQFEYLDQYYVANSTSGLANSVLSGVEGAEDYLIRYEARNQEMFISLLLLRSRHDEYLLTNIYGKYPEGWKLNILQLGRYSYHGKNAPAYYAEAQTAYEKGHLMDAANYMMLSAQLAKPANKFWRYQREEDFRTFYDQVRKEGAAAHTLPKTITDLHPAPQIVSIYPMCVDEGCFPMVEYLTQIDVADTTELKRENDALHAIIGNHFTGLDKDKAFLLYKTFNTLPEANTPVATYGFVQEL